MRPAVACAPRMSAAMAAGELTVRTQPGGRVNQRRRPAALSVRPAGVWSSSAAPVPGGRSGLVPAGYSFGWMAPSMMYTVPLPAVIGSPITLMSLT